jgi:3-oxoadipate enol-lactonase
MWKCALLQGSVRTVTTFRLKNKPRALYYRIRGDGEHLLLIHGLGSCGEDWEFQVRALERRFRVIVPDLPGTGRSSPTEGKDSIADYAQVLWALIDHLKISRVNVAGFSLGGAVALEMALQRPDCVPRLAMINSLATYRVDHWRKWLEARLPPVLIRLMGMRGVAKLVAARLFPAKWQRPLRERAVARLAAVTATSYLGMARALERWSALDRLSTLKARTLLIAAEHDYTPLAEKVAMAKAMGAAIAVVHGSRHGTPFDAVAATNACLISLFTDRSIHPSRRLVCDGPPAWRRLTRITQFAEDQTAISRLEFGF